MGHRVCGMCPEEQCFPPGRNCNPDRNGARVAHGSKFLLTKERQAQPNLIGHIHNNTLDLLNFPRFMTDHADDMIGVAGFGLVMTRRPANEDCVILKRIYDIISIIFPPLPLSSVT
jgi:hypothetical protein